MYHLLSLYDAPSIPHANFWYTLCSKPPRFDWLPFDSLCHGHITYIKRTKCSDKTHILSELEIVSVVFRWNLLLHTVMSLYTQFKMSVIITLPNYWRLGPLLFSQGLTPYVANRMVSGIYDVRVLGQSSPTKGNVQIIHNLIRNW